jgi:hypothetical protein
MIPVFVATTWQALVAEEPVGTTPQANSIQEWKAGAAANSAATTPARSIREWKATPAAPPAATSTATLAANPAAAPTFDSAAPPTATAAAKPAVSVAAPKNPMTISITSSLREGNLVIVLDDVPIFNEKFKKPVLLITQTTTWDPLQVAAGEHRLFAKVYGTKKTYLSKLYDLHLSRTKGSALRLVIQGDKLTVELAS